MEHKDSLQAINFLKQHGYSLIRRKNQDSKIYDAIDDRSNSKVCIRVSSGINFERGREEYELLKSIHSKFVITPYNLIETSQNNIPIQLLVTQPFLYDLGWRLTYMSTPTHLEVCKIALDLVRSLSDLHSKNIVHLDLKPQSIVLGTDLKWRIFDLNVAMQLQPQQNLLPFIKGMNFYYSSPEQYTQFVHKSLISITGKASDVYSLGLLFMKVTGKEIEYSDLIKSKMRNYCFLKQMNKKFPEFNQINSRMLEFLPHERPSLSQIEDCLLEIIEKINPTHLRSLKKVPEILDMNQTRNTSMNSFTSRRNIPYSKSNLNISRMEGMTLGLRSVKNSSVSRNKLLEYSNENNQNHSMQQVLLTNSYYPRTNYLQSHSNTNSFNSPLKDSLNPSCNSTSPFSPGMNQTFNFKARGDEQHCQSNNQSSDLSNLYENADRRVSEVATDCQDIQLCMPLNYKKAHHKILSKRNLPIHEQIQQTSIVKTKPQLMISRQRVAKLSPQSHLPSISAVSISKNHNKSPGASSQLGSFFNFQ